MQPAQEPKGPDRVMQEGVSESEKSGQTNQWHAKQLSVSDGVDDGPNST